MAFESRRNGNELAWAVRAIRKHLFGIVLLVGVAVAAAAAYVVLREDEYVAYAEILIEPVGDSFGNLKEDRDRVLPVVEPAEMETALKLVTSNKVLRPAIDRLNFRLSSQEGAGFAKMMQGWFKAEALENEPSAQPNEATVLRLFREKLIIQRDALASIISIGYRSTDPKEAATVANTVAEIYLDERLKAKREVYSRTALHLDQRVKEMATWLRSAEAEIERYKADADLYEVGGAAPVEQRYAKLSDQLTEANIALTEAKARLSQADRTFGDEAADDIAISDLDSIKEVQASAVIGDLRRQESEFNGRLADLRSQYGKNHPLVLNTLAGLADVKASIEAEIRRIVEQLNLEVDVAANRVATIEQNLREAQRQLDSSQASRIGLRELERDVAGPSRVYELLLDRSQRAREQEKLVADTARIVSQAIAPDRPDQLSGKLLLGVVCFAFGSAGAGLAVVRELRRPGYLDADSLIDDLQCKVLGLVPRVRRASGSGATSQKRSLEAFAFVEAVRGIVQKIVPRYPDKVFTGAKVLAVTSCFPDEGKTTLSLSLARQASFGGLKVLMIEGDLRKAGLREKLKTMEIDTGLVHVLKGTATADDAIVEEPASQVDMLFGLGPAKDAFRLIRSPNMNALIEEKRQLYDLIVVDCGPALAVSDTQSLLELADGVVFVVRWQTTERSAVRGVLRDLKLQQIDIAGVVMTQIDLAEHMKYGETDQLHYQEKYHSYAMDI
ncbi:MAG: GumC family protein [Geminicoccales bacterium]